MTEPRPDVLPKRTPKGSIRSDTEDRWPTPNTSGTAPSLPHLDAEEHPVDIERLRSSASAAVAAESARDDTERGLSTASDDEHRSSGSRYLVAAVVGMIVLVTALVAFSGDDRRDADTRARDAAAMPTGADSTVAPAADAPSTEAPATTLPATTVTPAAPTTAAPPAAAPPADPPADPNAPPPHKATYRAGKLYLEGRVASQEEAQKYVDKAAAVLGADNVVNNYAIDPAVPVSTDGTVYVDEPFLFATGSAELNPQYTGILGLGIAAMKLNPNARMVVTGYTDSQGDPARNEALSVERATAVVDYMVATGGIDRARFDAIGAGDRNPVADNATPEGRRLNRRIDVKLVNLLG
ncbi:MAG: OmpA family protein [Microthrixaceae bacterium]|nr:OmpA family protein [Microthrixaceae bacterium]